MTKAKMTKLNLEQLEERMCPAAASIFGPNAHVVYHGGPLLTNPQVTNVYVGSVPNMDAFTNVLVGPYGAALASVYGVGSGTFVQSIYSSHSPTINDTGIQNLLSRDFQTGVLPPPVPNSSLYMVYLPHAPGGSGGGDAYHASFSYHGQQVAYAVSWGTKPQTLAWDASHEYDESATDPLNAGTGWWRGNCYTGEICDITNTFAWFDGYKMAQFALPKGFSFPSPPPAPAPHPSSPPPAPQPSSLFALWQDMNNLVLQDFETILTILGSIERDLARYV